MMIVNDGRLTVPLFHGTSSLFWDSIIRNGLGGRNIVEEMDPKAAQLLLQLSSGYHHEENWLLAIDGCERIAADPMNDRLDISGFFFSFRYGGTYLSASSETAANYALLYSGGGEALTSVLHLYRLLVTVRPDVATHERFMPLIEFASRRARPMLVEANGVELNSLRAEQGGGIEEVLERMESAFEDAEFYDTLVGQANFELTRPMPRDQLKFHNITRIQECDDQGASREVIRLSPFLSNQPVERSRESESLSTIAKRGLL